MITYTGLFQIVFMLCAVITLVNTFNHKNSAIICCMWNYGIMNEYIENDITQHLVFEFTDADPPSIHILLIRSVSSFGILSVSLITSIYSDLYLYRCTSI